MKKFIFVAVLMFSLTVFLANSFAGEANQYVKAENEALAKNAQRSFILANDGTVLARLCFENREDIPLSNVPLDAQHAFIAIEDERYYQHHGVDYMGIGRALLTNLKSRRVVEGGSTITQQYVKNSIGSKDRTLVRKVREAIIASRLEKKYSKQQILEAYLNTIYFGQGAYGIEAASEVFFNKKANALTLSESALLAGVTKSPDGFSPYTHPDQAYARQALVLDKMLSQGYITAEQAEAAKKEHPPLAAIKPDTVIAPYFVEYVKQQLINEYGVDKVFKGGLRIYTTLNPKSQEIAEDSVRRELYYKDDPQAALVSIVPQTGQIVAMVGGRDFGNVKYNLATQGKRQPGSSFKPFVLVTALKQGLGPNDTFDSSSPQEIRTSSNPRAKPWIVHNSEGKGYGMMTLREATVHSVNAVYANLVMKVGPQNVVNTAHDMGITTKLDAYPAMGIGGLTIGVSPLEMASAYGTLANGGVHVDPIAVTKIVDADGKVVKETKPATRQSLDPQIAAQAIDIMEGVIQRGTATRADIGRPAAGKTGTNEEFRDAWFVGFTPNLVTSVWMGYPHAQVSMYDVHGSRGFGGIIPASIWHRFMGRVLSGTPVLDFPPANWSSGQLQGNDTPSDASKNKQQDNQTTTSTDKSKKWKKRYPRKSQRTTQKQEAPKTSIAATPVTPPETSPPQDQQGNNGWGHGWGNGGGN